MSRLRVICNGCGKRVWVEDAPGVCTICAADQRELRGFERFLDRWFGPPAETESEYYHRHRQLTELLWSADGRGQEYYNILRPGVPYSRFITRVTDIVCEGVLEGWVELRIPAVPTIDEAAYGVVFTDPDRFAARVTAEFGTAATGQPHPPPVEPEAKSPGTPASPPTA